ncbi:hypothetical protein HU200_059867 [Digitaria exilis]|uniref:Uncharacterized protein n=1 Tax=Digitaria exilis TaxID=1010633 RepID=A0A835E278_9POAL|nr:hypothetical protein HU200_059867 [Digitaria exilis]
MLNWYIEYKKNQHAGFAWKRTHHAKCADALNKQFAMGVTDRARRLLAKPIKFFHEMEELFKDCDSDDSRGLNDISGYAHPADHADDDSDTLPSPEAKQISPNYAASGDNSSSSTHRSGKKRSRGYKSPSKKPLKSKKPLRI